MISRISKSSFFPFLASSDSIIRRHFPSPQHFAFQSPWRVQEFSFSLFFISYIVPFTFHFTEQGSALRHGYNTAFRCDMAGKKVLMIVLLNVRTALISLTLAIFALQVYKGIYA